MNTIAIVIVGLVWFASSLAFSQTPGYLGKKFSLFYQLGPHSSIYTKNDRNEQIYYSGWRARDTINNTLALKWEAGIEWVVARNFSVFVSMERMRHGFHLWHPVEYDFWSTGPEYELMHYRTVYKSTFFGVRYYPYWWRGNIAPLGPSFYFASGPMSLKRYRKKWDDPNAEYRGGGNAGIEGINLKAGFGYQEMIGDRFFYFFRIHFGIAFFNGTVNYGADDLTGTARKKFYHTYDLVNTGGMVGAGVLLF